MSLCPVAGKWSSPARLLAARFPNNATQEQGSICTPEIHLPDTPVQQETHRCYKTGLCSLKHTEVARCNLISDKMH